MKLLPQNDVVILEQPEFMQKISSSKIKLDPSTQNKIVEEFYQEHSGLFTVHAVGPVIKEINYPGLVTGAKVRLSDAMYIKPFTIKDGDNELNYVMTNAHNISIVLGE